MQTVLEKVVVIFLIIVLSGCAGAPERGDPGTCADAGAKFSTEILPS